MDVLYEMVSSVAGIELAPGGGLRDAFAMREVVVASDDEPLAGQKAREVAIALDMLGHAVGNLDNTAGTGTALVAPRYSRGWSSRRRCSETKRALA